MCTASIGAVYWVQGVYSDLWYLGKVALFRHMVSAYRCCWSSLKEIRLLDIFEQESLSYEKRNIREQFSCKYIPKDTGLLTPTASTETLVGRLCEASCVTPTLTPRSTQKTSSSVNGSNRKRQISIIPVSCIFLPKRSPTCLRKFSEMSLYSSGINYEYGSGSFTTNVSSKSMLVCSSVLNPSYGF